MMFRVFLARTTPSLKQISLRRSCSMRKILFVGLIAITAAAATRCSGSANAPMSPSAVAGGESALNPDGSNLKVTAPSGLSPSGGATVDTIRPTISFNASTGRFTTAPALAYEIEVYTDSGSLVYSRIVNGTSHQLDTDLQYSTNYTHRSRARLGNDAGPWSATAAFRTLDRPGPTAPATGTLPFAVPEACGPGGPTNRFGCVLGVASQSAEWALCARGVGIGCHRFARQVVYALSRSDPNWKMIRAAPGGHACNCGGCGPSDGSMFREDTAVYGGNQVFDMIGGAGGPTPSLGWSFVGAPRSGDLPDDAPLCLP
jgi:hypothetical protein